MSPKPEPDPFCIECHWENFHMADSDLLSPAECFDLDCWSGGAEPEGQPLNCDMSVECCDMDGCSRDCTTVCDGFADCDKSTICSDSYCDNSNCQGSMTACFDKNCVLPHFDHPPNDHHTFLHQDGHINWECVNLSPEHTNCGFHGESLEHSFPHFHPTNSTSLDFSSTIKDLGHTHFYTPQSFEPQSQVVSNACLDHGLAAICVNDTADLCQATENCGYQRKVDNELPLAGCPGISPFASIHSARLLHHRYNHNQNSFQGLTSHLCTRHEATPTVTASSRTTPSLSLHSSPVPGSTIQEVASNPLFDSSDFLGSDELHICRWIDNKIDNKICGTIFPDAGSLQKHLTMAHADPTQGRHGQGYYCCWEGCSRPDEPFSQKSKLQGHFLTHSNFKSFRCSICGKPFARQATLERHERSHRGDKPYKCKECGKKFTDSSELKTHMRTHTGEKPFKCNHPGCTFETGDSSNMSSHKLTHGERKHKCPYPGCSKSFTRPDQLKRHLKGTHKHSSLITSRVTSPIGTSIANPLASPITPH